MEHLTLHLLELVGLFDPHMALSAVGGLVDWLDSLVLSTEFSWGMLLIVIGVLILLGEPLYVVLGSVTAFLLLTLPDFPPYHSFAGSLNVIVEETRILSDKVELLAIPFFVLAGAIMTHGDIARRLIDVARAFFGWLPGGLAISAVAACMFFAAISGSSPVTVIAIGTMMYPVLKEEGYPDRFSTGVVTSAGSLGILIPPSIPMLIFAIVLGQSEGGWAEPIGLDGQPAYGNLVAESGLDNVGALFLAGIGPGLLIGCALAVYSLFVGKRQGVNTTPFSFKVAREKVFDGFWALMLPVLILGGIYTGTFTVTQAAAVAVVYAFLVEVFIHGGLELRQVPKIFAESAVLMGSLLLIIAMALGFNRFLVKAEVPELAVELIRGWDMSTLEFLLVLNVLLLIVGCLMDIMSAILILVPLISPIAFEMGIHPVHLAIIFIVNLEIGYLTPPLGLNLFVASTIFKKPIGEVVMSVLPFTLIIGGCVLIVTYVPSVSLGPLKLMAGESPFVGFPETLSSEEAANITAAPVGNEQSVADLMKDDEQQVVTESGETVTYPSADTQLTDAMSELPDDAFLTLLDFTELMTGRQMHVVLDKGKQLTEAQFVALAEALLPIYEAVDDETITAERGTEIFGLVVERIEPLDAAALGAMIDNDELGVSQLLGGDTGGEDTPGEPNDDATPDDDAIDDEGSPGQPSLDDAPDGEESPAEEVPTGESPAGDAPGEEAPSDAPPADN